MIPTTDKDPALLEQARAIVKKLSLESMNEYLDARMPRQPSGYTLRYVDLRQALAVEVAYEALASVGQPAPVAPPARLTAKQIDQGGLATHDIDLIAKGIAAGLRAAEDVKVFHRTAASGDATRARMRVMHDALDALQRVAKGAPPAPAKIDLSRPAALELWREAGDQLRARLERDPITIETAVEFAILLMARTGPAAAQPQEGQNP